MLFMKDLKEIVKLAIKLKKPVYFMRIKELPKIDDEKVKALSNIMITMYVEFDNEKYVAIIPLREVRILRKSYITWAILFLRYYFGLSENVIAGILKTSTANVHRVLRYVQSRYNVRHETMKPGRKERIKIDKNEVIKLFGEKRTLEEIASTIGIHPSTLLYKINKDEELRKAYEELFLKRKGIIT